MYAILHGAEALRAAPCALGTPCIIKPVDQIAESAVDICSDSRLNDTYN